jgi:hypothetical protein
LPNIISFFLGFGVGFICAAFGGFLVLTAYFYRLGNEAQEEIYGKENNNENKPTTG